MAFERGSFAAADFDLRDFAVERGNGIPINAYKQFKAIDRNGNTYYMSGKSPYGSLNGY